MAGEKFTFNDLKWEANAPAETTLTFAGDPRRDTARDYLRNAVVMAYEKNRIPQLWPCIVVSRRVANSLSIINQNVISAGIAGVTQTQRDNYDTDGTVATYYIYKVVNVLNNPLPYPFDACDPILLHYPDVQASSNITEDIPLGTFVKLTYEDPDHLKGGTIVELGGHIEIGFGDQEASLKDLWLDRASGGMTNWDSRETQLKIEWTATDTEGLPAGTELFNGEISDFLLDTYQGAKLIPPAMADYKKLVAAYEERFPGKKLMAFGYRTYQSQVDLRVIREEGDSCPENEGEPTNGAGAYDKNCKFVGIAATPGTSNHGWGAAVDLVGLEFRDARKNGTAPHSEEFRWINQYASEYNFVFGVPNEHWHLDWMPFSSKVTGLSRATAQQSWTTSTTINRERTVGVTT